MTKRLNNLINFLWIKVEEKFSKPSHAFRYFDEQCRSKVSYKEFESGIEKLKIKFHRDEMKRIFEYLDSDKDKYLNYIEFSKLNKSSNITSRLPGYSFAINNSNPSNSRLKSRVKSNDVRADQNYADEIDKLSISSFYYRGYKYGGSRLGRQESRLSNYSWISGNKHGIPSPTNDNIGEIINHSYAYDNQKNESYQMRNIKKINVLPNVPTKASKLRDDFIRDKRIEDENHKNNDSKPEWKLRQFLGIEASENISESIKNIK